MSLLPRDQRPFTCPRGCLFTFGGIKRFSTFKGWRKHMDEKHGGPSEAELETINAVLGAASEATKSQAQLELEAEPNASQLDSEGKPLPTDAAPATEAAERKERQSRESKRINKEINEKAAEIQKLLFEGVPKMIFDGLARSQENDLYKLSANQEQWIRDSFDLASKAMGVNWEIEPWNITVKNPLWLLSLPFLVIGFIFIGKKRAVDAQKAGVEVPAPAPEQVQ